MMKKTRKNLTPEKLTRVQKFSLWFFDHFKVTSILWIGLAVFGALSYGIFMRREGFPNVAAPFSVVRGTYFVNDSRRVDSEVAKPISDIIQKRTDVKTVSLRSDDNFYVIQVQYKDGSDAVTASQEIADAAKADANIPSVATVISQPIAVGKLSNDGDDLLISVSKDPDTSAQELQKIADSLGSYLAGDNGIASAERVKTVSQFRTGTDPASGESVSQQASFDRSITSVGGRLVSLPSATIGVKAKSGVDALHLYDQATAAINRAGSQGEFQNVHISVSADFAESIRSQVSSLQKNLIGGLIAVIIISFLLISLRSSIATALSMVTVLTITIGGLYAIGYTLNTITLFSLILCLGLIVDDTTIVIEAVDAARRTGGDLRLAIAGAVKRVALASTAGTFVTMLAFAPLLFVSGILGSFIRAIPVTIILSLAVSLLVSLSLVPFLGRFILHSKKVTWTDKSLLGRVESSIAGGLAATIESTKRSKFRRVILSLGAILFSTGMLFAGGAIFSKVGFNIFPATKDSDALSVSLVYGPNTTIEHAQLSAAKAADIIKSEVGSNLKRASLYADGTTQNATFAIDLVSYRDREIKSPEIVAKLKESFKNVSDLGAVVEVAQTDVGPPAGGFAVRIYTDDRAAAERLALSMQEYLAAHDLTRKDGTVAKVLETKVTDESSVVREGGRQYVVVSAKYDGSDTTALTTLAKSAVEKEFTAEKIAQYGLTKDAVVYDFGSESDNQESFKTMLLAFPVLLIAMYILLMFQFKSLLQPLLIFLAIPFSFFGIAAGLYGTHNPFSFFTLIGFFALIGISVNNTILLTDYANQARRRGLRSVDAASEALRHRFRPLLTTSLTSVVALVPLALSDPFWESLAFTLIFGLLSSTLLVVIAFPYFYLISEWLRARFSRRRVLGWLGGVILVTFVTAVIFGGATAAGIVAVCIALTILRSVLLKIRPGFTRVS